LCPILNTQARKFEPGRNEPIAANVFKNVS